MRENKRLQNFLASVAILSFVYIFYTNIPYFQNYFNTTDTIVFFGWEYQIITFSIFKVTLYLYILTLLFLYSFEKEPHTAKAVYCLRALHKIVLHPLKTFEEGLPKKEKRGLLTVMVKAFFTPLMLAWVFAHIANLLSNFSFVWQNAHLLTESMQDFLNIFQTHLFWLLFQIILFADVFFFTIGYLVESPFLKNQIRSVDPTVGGWVVALICYPPFNSALGNFVPWPSQDFPFFESPFWYVSLNLLLLVLMGVYAWASVALNFKASNLTHRGIIAHGPYAYIRHPAYVCKNLAWWVGALPALIHSFQTGVFDFAMVIIAMLVWNGIYFLRALTEERHLRMVNLEYDAYMQKVPYRFIPKVL